MKRYHFIVPVAGLLFAAGFASADYLRIKVNVNPQVPGAGGGGDNKGGPMGGMAGGVGMSGGFGGGAPGMAGGLGMGGAAPGMAGGLGMGGGLGGPGFGGGGPGFKGGFGMGGGPGGSGGAGLLGGPPGPGMGGGGPGMMGGGPGMAGGGPGMAGGGPGFMGGGPGFMGGGPGMAGGGPDSGALAPEDSQIQWLYVYLEVKNFRPAQNPNFKSAWIEHKWSEKGKWSALMAPPGTLVFEHFPAKPRVKEFDDEIKRELKTAKAKQLTARSMLKYARQALANNLTKQFHDMMADLGKELARLDPKDDTVQEIGPIVRNYLRVQQELKKAPPGEDPAFKALKADLVGEKFTQRYDGGHYSLWYSSNFKGAESDAMIKQKLARLEEHLETFYYWFALIDKDAHQPKMPQYRLEVVMTNADQFRNRRIHWGIEPDRAGDGFTPQHANVLFLSAKRQDVLYSQMARKLEPLLADARTFLTKNNVPTADLLSGKIWDDKKVGMYGAVIQWAQTLEIVQKAFEEDAERQTITYEGTRQLLVASGMFPRHVAVPEWVLSGLASYFETPEQAPYGGVGLASWSNLISFKYFQKEKSGRLAFNKAGEVLFNTITDRYFEKARIASELSQEKVTDEALADKARDEWDFARCTAWAFTYYVINNSQQGQPGINRLFRYGEELNKLPRDLDLTEAMLQGCAAKAFELGGKTAGRIDTGQAHTLGTAWFTKMDQVTLEVPAIQQFHLVQRELMSRPRAAPTTPSNPAGPGGAPGFPGPGGPGGAPGFPGPKQ